MKGSRSFCALGIALCAVLPLHAATLSAGLDHNLAVVGGQVWGWGGNAGGKLGNGATTNSAIPVRAGTLTGVVSVATGMAESFAVRSDGTLWAWGVNDNGQLGIGATVLPNCTIKVQNTGLRPCATSPVQVTGISNVAAVAAGWGHAVALKTDSTVWTWGSTQSGALGRTGTTNVPAAVPGLTGVTKIAAGYFHTIALKSDGTVVAFGNDTQGELGDGPGGTGTLRAVATLTGVVDISARGGFNLALKSDGSVWMWGQTRYGQKGDGAIPALFVESPVQVFASGIAEIAAGWGHALVRKTDNTVWAWGHNSSGQIGPTSPNVSPNGCGSALNKPCARGPIQIASGASAIAAGGAHSLIIKPNGDISGMGDNDSAQLGNQSGNFGGTASFASTTYDPEFTLTPLGTFGSGGSVGTGSTAGDLNLSNLANGVYFPVGLVGSPTGTSPVTVTNLNASVAIGFTSISVNGDFSSTNNCGASLPPVSTCQVNITFTATGTGTRSGELTLNTDISDSPTVRVALTGNGVSAPDAPTGVAATAGNASATVSFSAPSNNGGSAITSYSVTSNPGSIVVIGGASPIAVNGLVNGTSYTFTVRASNAYGTGAPSAESAAVTPRDASSAVVTSSPNPSVQGGAIRITGTVSGSSGTPTGTVVFWADGAPGVGIALPGCGARPLAGGVAVCDFSSFSAATHTITAEYSGDTVYAPSNSAPYTQVVNSGPATLTVSKSGGGSGLVTSSPSGINCGADCSEPYAGGTSVTLTAVPNVSSVFAGWSGACTGFGACIVSMNAARSVTATFARSGASAVDFNADGRPDIIWSNTANGSTYLWHMNGASLISDAFIAGIDPSWKIQGVADFNGDGKPDLVWRNTATGNTYVWYMNGSTFVSDAFLFSLPPEWVIQGVADFNADGKPDFLMRNTNSGVAFAWFFNDNVAIGDQFLFGIDPQWKVEAVADLNHDGQPDLLFRNMSSGLAFAWNTSWNGANLALAASSAPIFGIDPVWEIVQMADWNGDGDPDLLFRNRNSGLVFVWYLNGTTLAGSAFITQIDPSWEIVPRR